MTKCTQTVLLIHKISRIDWFLMGKKYFITQYSTIKKTLSLFMNFGEQPKNYLYFLINCVYLNDV